MSSFNLTYRLLFIAATLGLASPAFAGHEIGNGGGAWVCRESGGAAVRWAEPVDVWEARYEFGLNVAETPDAYTDVVDRARARLAQASPKLAAEIAQDLARIDYLMLNPPHVMYTIDILEIIDDSLYRLRPNPRRCEGGVVAYEQVVNYKMDGNILVQSEIFTENTPGGANIFGPIDRTATVLHEAIYAYRRRAHGDKNSVITRRLVGLIISDIPIGVLRAEIAKLDK